MFLTNVKWITPEGTVNSGTLQIEDGRLKTWPGDFCVAKGHPVCNLRSHLVIPGLVDPHVHFRQPGAFHKEGIDNGSKAALAGGVTTVLDMPNNLPPVTTPGRFRDKQALFQRHCRVHWGVHYHADPSSRLPVPAQAASLKIYMAKSSMLPAVTQTDDLVSLFRRHPRVAIHAEDETAFVAGAGRTVDVRAHHLLRPVSAVEAALTKIRTALRQLPPVQRPRIILCHMGTASEVRWLEEMKNDHFDVWGETCPHYYLCDTRDVERQGSPLKVNPPIREPEHREAILEGLRNGTIDFLGTDHAPHTPKEKAQPVGAPSGIAAIEVLAPAAFLLADRYGVSMGRLLELTASNACRCYDIPDRGAIRDGMLADLCVISTTPGRSRSGTVITKAGTHPYLNTEFTRCVEATWVAGQQAFGEQGFDDTVRGQEVYS